MPASAPTHTKNKQQQADYKVSPSQRPEQYDKLRKIEKKNRWA